MVIDMTSLDFGLKGRNSIAQVKRSALGYDSKGNAPRPEGP
jgi:hypothetical protein